MAVAANIYIARHERHEAAEAYKDRMTKEQIEALLEGECDFWFKIRADGTTQLLAIEDEG